MAASEAAVTAVMEALGCEQDEFAGRYCAGSCSVKDAFGEWVPAEWTARGCEVAVAAADAAVDADRASIQAETLREAAKALDWVRPEKCDATQSAGTHVVGGDWLTVTPSRSAEGPKVVRP